MFRFKYFSTSSTLYKTRPLLSHESTTSTTRHSTEFLYEKYEKYHFKKVTAKKAKVSSKEAAAAAEEGITDAGGATDAEVAADAEAGVAESGS